MTLVAACQGDSGQWRVGRSAGSLTLTLTRWLSVYTGLYWGMGHGIGAVRQLGQSTPPPSHEALGLLVLMTISMNTIFIMFFFAICVPFNL